MKSSRIGRPRPKVAVGRGHKCMRLLLGRVRTAYELCSGVPEVSGRLSGDSRGARYGINVVYAFDRRPGYATLRPAALA
jgi:hypothetical protein